MHENMSRRRALSLLGGALSLTLSGLVPSEAEAQTPAPAPAAPATPAAPAAPAAPAKPKGTAGMRRRKARRAARRSRRQARRSKGKPAAAPEPPQ